MGWLWRSQYQSEFPIAQEQPSVEPGIEEFGVLVPPFEFRFESGVPLSRLWFLKDELGSEVLQVQRNWFARNWRRTVAKMEYPRYKRVRRAFERDFGKLESFLGDEDLGKIVPTQCEVTYVNHIERGQVWSSPSEMGKIIRLFKSSEYFLPPPEEVSLDANYVIPGPAEAPIGRLHIVTRPLYSVADHQPIIALTLTARGRPAMESSQGILEFLDLAHEWVVQGFTSVTSDAAHEEWGRIK